MLDEEVRLSDPQGSRAPAAAPSREPPPAQPRAPASPPAGPRSRARQSAPPSEPRPTSILVLALQRQAPGFSPSLHPTGAPAPGADPTRALPALANRALGALAHAGRAVDESARSLAEAIAASQKRRAKALANLP